MDIHDKPELLDHLAASHALGSLRGAARRRFEAHARQHPAVRVAALMWQERLASLTELGPAEVPGEAVWRRIENLIQAEREGQLMARRRAAPQASPSVAWWGRLGLWQALGGAGAAAAVALGTLLLVSGERAGTERAALQQQVAALSQQLSRAPDIRYVAVLNDDQAAPTLLATLDARNNRLVLRRVGSYREAQDRSLQLWALPPGGAPQSLGVLGREAVIRLSAEEARVRDVPALAISLEPLGGVPSERGPTGPVLFKGALLRTAT